MGKTLIVESEDCDENESNVSEILNFKGSPIEIAASAKAAGIEAAKSGNNQQAANFFRHGASILNSVLCSDKNESGCSPERELFVACLLNLSMMHLQAGHWEDTVAVSSEVLSLVPSNTKALFRRCRAQIMLGNFELGRADLEQLLLIEPNNIKVLELQKELEVHGITMRVTKSESQQDEAKQDVEKETSSQTDNFIYYELSWNPCSGEELGITVNTQDTILGELPVVEAVSLDREGEVFLGDIIVSINGGVSSMERLIEEVSLAKEMEQSVSLKIMRDANQENGRVLTNHKSDDHKEKLDHMLTQIAKQTSSMLAEMSLEDKGNLASMLGTDVAGLERLAYEVASTASSEDKKQNKRSPDDTLAQPCTDIPNDTKSACEILKPSAGISARLKVQTVTDEEEDIPAPQLDSTPSYEMTEGWLDQSLHNQEDGQLHESSDVVEFPAPDVDIRSIIEQLKDERKMQVDVQIEPTTNHDRYGLGLSREALDEDEIKMKERFQLIVEQKKLNELKKKTKGGNTKKNSTKIKGKKTEPSSEASSRKVWEELCDSEAKTIQVFKKRTEAKITKEVSKSIKKKVAKETNPSSKNQTLPLLVEDHWSSLVVEENKRVNNFNSKFK